MKKKLLIFLSHASEDKAKVRNLCKRLRDNGFDPWLDEQRLLPGQDWNLEIEKALRASDAILLCFSSLSVAKEGYIQREYKRAMRYLEEKPEGTIFVIPVRLDDCELPHFIRDIQWVDYPADYDRLRMSLQVRAGGPARPQKTRKAKEKKSASTKPTIIGNVLFEDGTPVEDAVVFVEGVDRRKRTDESGWFQIEVDEQASWMVRALYMDQVAKLSVAKAEVKRPVLLILKSNRRESDLVVSSFNSSGRLQPLPGHPFMQPPDLEFPIFTGGFRVRFSLAHNHQRDEAIKVTRVMIKVDEFIPGKSSEHQYNINLDRLIGRQIAEVRVFSVFLSGTDAPNSVWVDESRTPHFSNSDDLLDVTPPRILILEADHDFGEELDITVTAKKVGFYKVHFVFEYFVSGEDRVQVSRPIQFYFDE